MRKLIAFAALIFFSAVPAQAWHKKAKKAPAPIPAIVNAKSLGVHCYSDADDVVEINVCQMIIEGLRANFPKLTVLNCPDVLDSAQEVHTQCLPEPDMPMQEHDTADLMLNISEDYAYDDTYNTVSTSLLASLWSGGTQIANGTCSPGFLYPGPTEERAACIVKTWTNFIRLYGSPKTASREDNIRLLQDAIYREAKP